MVQVVRVDGLAFPIFKAVDVGAGGDGFVIDRPIRGEGKHGWGTPPAGQRS